MTRQPGELLLSDSADARDAQLYEKFKGVLLDAPEIYKDLDMSPDTKAAAIQAWRAGKEADLRPQHLDEDVLQIRASALRDFKTELLRDTEIPADLKQVYRWRVNEAIANIHMQQASLAGDDRNYRRWGEFVYGRPNAEIFKGALDHIANEAETLLKVAGQSEEVLAAAKQVLENLDGMRGDRSILTPSPETFANVRENHFRRDTGYYALLFSDVEMPHSGKVGNEEGDRILQHILTKNLVSDYEIVDAPGAAWGVVHSRKQVERPAEYNMPWQRFVGLGPGHEIGSHLLEYENGRRGPFMILSDLGLDRTELGNEGRALIREQVVYQSFEEFSKTVRWRDVLRRAIAIGYAHGTDASGSHSQVETYEFMLAIDRMYQARLTGSNKETTDQKARARTESLLTRIYRGGVYLKDMVYLEGNVACWAVAEERGPQSISYGDEGKYDISNLRHIKFLLDNGVLPEAA